MRHHRQLRWLIFLLIPFTILFAFHLFVPLLIKKTNHSLSQQKYRYDLISNQKQTIFSTHYCNVNSIQATMRQYLNQLLTVMEYQKSPVHGFINATNYTVGYINAYQLTSNPNSIVTNVSMWFSQNKTNVSQLSSTLNQLFSQFQDAIPLSIVNLFPQMSQVVNSYSFYMVDPNNQSLYLQYPAQQLSRFSDLNSSPLDDYYHDTIFAYSQNGDQPITVSFAGIDETNNESLLVLCRPQLQGTNIIVTCLKLNLKALGEQIGTNLKVGQGLYFESQVSMVLCNNLNQLARQDPQILLTYADPDSASFIIPSPPSFLNLIQYDLSPLIFSFSPNDYTTQFFLGQQNYTTFFVTPVESINNQILMHVMTKATIGGTELLPQRMRGDLNNIIIPVTLLAAFFTLVICIIMKKIMDAVDQELYHLDQRCKFIADGDINVEIPNYQKTQDMKAIYQRVKIINKLHRYSDQSYFTGHASAKILLYNQALQTIKSLNYDPGNLLQNLGENYNIMNEWNPSLKYLKESVDTILIQIEAEYGTLDDILNQKLKRTKFPRKFLQMQLILIRRLFKLCYIYIRYFQVIETGLTSQDIDFEKNAKRMRRFQKIKTQYTYYTDMFKKAVYPNITKYAQGIIILIFEIKLSILNNQFDELEMLEKKAIQILKIYTTNYPRITQQLKTKKKGSSHRLFFKANRLTDFSRSHPALLLIILNLVRAYKLKAENKSPDKWNKKILLFEQTFKSPIFYIGTSHLVMKQFRRMLNILKIDLGPLQTTKIYKQNLPYKTLHYGQITTQDEDKCYKWPVKTEKVSKDSLFCCLTVNGISVERTNLLSKMELT